MKMALLAAISAALLSGNLYAGEKCCGGSAPVRVAMNPTPLPPEPVVPANTASDEAPSMSRPCFCCHDDTVLGPIAKTAVKSMAKSSRRMRLLTKAIFVQLEAASLCREELRLNRKTMKLAHQVELLETDMATAAACDNCQTRDSIVSRELEIGEQTHCLEHKLSSFERRQERHRERVAEVEREQAELQSAN